MYVQKEIMENEAPSVIECVLNTYVIIFVYGAPAGCVEMSGRQRHTERSISITLTYESHHLIFCVKMMA